MKDIRRLLNIKSNNMEPTRGKILISEPFLGDFYFSRSVVLIAEHNEEGSFGLIVNKPLSTEFNEVVKDFPEFNSRIYLGGPVQNNSLFFMHTLGELIEGSQEILNGLYWGGDIEQVKDMITLNQITPENIRFYIGYSGWASDQLNGELKRNSWLVSDINADTLLHSKPEDLWNISVNAMGDKYAFWSKFPVDPSMN